ncbi:hypothetical protein RJ639_041959 [Escallonia herrerae]|uniref:Thaumatin-like protein n=1 Tax=Escallonia herrerae TaxID=1293975 RepID=A0AA89B5N0_9ASTE|nr:hypothetical protein RJ639_041959 [Escallonia herrerae]
MNSPPSPKASLSVSSQGATFTVENKCQYTVWPGILSNGRAQISTTGFELQKGELRTITAPPSWNGRFWGRTLCAVNSATRNFTCVTGDCGSGKVECSGGGPAPPTTFLEFSVDGPNGADFFDDRYCCSGAYGTPSTCRPTLYSRVFKDACPRAYSYSFDDVSSTFTCDSGAHYLITFCPSPSTRVTLDVGCKSSQHDDEEVKLEDHGLSKQIADVESIRAKATAAERYGLQGRCETLGQDAYGTPNTCRPTLYSQVFKDA